MAFFTPKSSFLFEIVDELTDEQLAEYEDLFEEDDAFEVE